MGAFVPTLGQRTALPITASWAAREFTYVSLDFYWSMVEREHTHPMRLIHTLLLATSAFSFRGLFFLLLCRTLSVSKDQAMKRKKNTLWELKHLVLGFLQFVAGE